MSNSDEGSETPLSSYNINLSQRQETRESSSSSLSSARPFVTNSHQRPDFSSHSRMLENARKQISGSPISDVAPKRSHPESSLSGLPQRGLKRKATSELAHSPLVNLSSSLGGLHASINNPGFPAPPAFGYPGAYGNDSVDESLLNGFFTNMGSGLQSNVAMGGGSVLDINGEPDSGRGSGVVGEGGFGFGGLTDAGRVHYDDAEAMAGVVYQNPTHGNLERNLTSQYNPTLAVYGPTPGRSTEGNCVISTVKPIPDPRNQFPRSRAPTEDSDAELPENLPNIVPSLIASTPLDQYDIFSTIKKNGYTLPAINSASPLVPRVASPQRPTVNPAYLDISKGGKLSEIQDALHQVPPRPKNNWDTDEPISVVDLLNNHFYDVCIDNDYTHRTLRLHRWPHEGPFNRCTTDPIAIEKIVTITGYFRSPDGKLVNISWGDLTKPIIQCKACGQELEKNRRCEFEMGKRLL